jgi:hypothetical protein
MSGLEKVACDDAIMESGRRLCGPREGMAILPIQRVAEMLLPRRKVL